MATKSLLAIKLFIVIEFCFLAACKNNQPIINNSNQLSIVKDSVKAMAELIAKKLSQNGPTEWLKIFEDSPGFFMANNGQLAFANYDSATVFINNILIKKVNRIELTWNNMRIDALSPNLASLAADYKESITDFAGKTITFNGYFTSIAKQTSQGWKLHNVHWSSVLPAK